MRRGKENERVGLKAIYDKQYVSGRYASSSKSSAEEHAHYELLKRFVGVFKLRDKRCLEVGCGRGAFQDLVRDYVGVDISEVAGRSSLRRFVTASATALPFPDDSFDAIWSVTTLEHVPDPERALVEMRRTMRSGGVLLLAPAWFCRSWAAGGYAVRPYSEFDRRGKIVKAFIPLRNSIAYRLPGVLARRTHGLASWFLRRAPTQFTYRSLTPNYDQIWTSDSDAVNSMDPFEAILWFVSRGDRCLNYPSLASAFRVRTGAIIIRMIKS